MNLGKNQTGGEVTFGIGGPAPPDARERLFLVLVGIFLGSLVIANVLVFKVVNEMNDFERQLENAMARWIELDERSKAASSGSADVEAGK